MPRNDQLVRWLKLARILSDSRRGLPLKVIAERHGWLPRTLYRDIEGLEAAGFPVIRDENRFRLPADTFKGAGSQLQPDERLALFTMRQLASGLRETTTGRALERLWQRFSGERPDAPLLLPTDAAPKLDVRSPLAIDYSAHRRTIAVIEEALSESRVLSCRYEAITTGELTARAIEPGELHWDPTLESLYLIGWCRLRQAVRVFGVHRFRMVSPQREQFRPRPECRSRAALRDAFHIWRGGNVQRVVVRLRGWAAREARERKLHPSQETTRLPGGEVRIAIEVAGLEEVSRWVLSYGSLAVAEAPDDLVRFVRAELDGASGAYDAPGAEGASDSGAGDGCRRRSGSQRGSREGAERAGIRLTSGDTKTEAHPRGRGVDERSALECGGDFRCGSR